MKELADRTIAEACYRHYRLVMGLGVAEIFMLLITLVIVAFIGYVLVRVFRKASRR